MQIGINPSTSCALNTIKVGCKTVSEVIIRAVKKIAQFVKSFFSLISNCIYRCFFSAPQAPYKPARNWGNREDYKPFHNYDWRGNFRPDIQYTPTQPISTKLSDEPATENLQKLKNYFRSSFNTCPKLSKHLTPKDFCTLIDEFPYQKTDIGETAIKWAADREIHIDPQHKFFEIFQKAFELKDSIPGGQYAPSDHTQWISNSEDYTYASHFTYAVKVLMGFQELTRDDTLELINKLDNKQLSAHGNPAYRFARSLSKIYAYPIAHGDLRNKLQIAVGAPWEAYILAKSKNEIVKFFKEAFHSGHICFDIRVSDFQTFTLNLIDKDAADFNVRLNPNPSCTEKCFEHYRVFRNKQVLKMVKSQYGDDWYRRYTALRDDAASGRETDSTRELHRSYCTEDDFAKYLEEDDQPIRENLVRTTNSNLPVLPIQRDWNWKLPLYKREVPLSAIPPQARKDNADLRVEDPSSSYYSGTYYKVKVAKVLPDQGKAIIDFRGEPIPRAKWVEALDIYW